MALDKQRILSELGSVMNQLQSADCGCMGKLFSNPSQGCNGNPLPTCGGCRRGSCPGHGYGMHYNNMQGGGEPYSMNNGGMHGNGMQEGGMPGGMQGCGMGGMQRCGMGGMQRCGMGGMQRCGMGGMQSGGMGGMHPGGMHGGGMGSMHEGGMQEGEMAGMQNSGMQDSSSIACRMRGMPCMGRNAPKLYADTYNYLNQNLMQPLVKEVYDDLRTITPQNTVGHNPLAAKMGLSPADTGTAAIQSNTGALNGQMPDGAMRNPNMGAGSPEVMGGHISAGGRGEGPGGSSINDPNAQMGGMGSHIVNMMSSGGRRPANMTNHGSQLQEPMVIDAPQSPHGQVGVTPLSPGAGQVAMNQGQPNAGMNSMGQGNPPGAMMQNPTTQYVSQDQIHPANSNVLGNPMANSSAHTQQPVARNSKTYGQHSAGIKKFNEMFPGVMQGDLNFDPMAIAIQMNPANQQKAAMDTMTKLMDGNNGTSSMKPALTGAEAAVAAVSQPGSAQDQRMAQVAPQNMSTGRAENQDVIQGHQHISPNQQLVYSATGAPVMDQQFSQQQIPLQQKQGQQVITSGYEEAPTDANAQLQGQPPQHVQAAGQEIIEPIHPVDTSKNNVVGYAMPQYTYNTLGQPIEMLSPNAYHQSMGMSGPQTLSGGLGRGYGVKNTMSKTSLAGNRPLGTTASRSQLQHIYRQYKASHSATQQHIRAPPVQGGSLSEGQLNTAPASTPANMNPPIQQTYVEKVGGDSIANNPTVQMAKVEPVKPDQTGDVPAVNTPQGDSYTEKSPGAMVQKRGRNGLQDITYTPYRATAGWSFHG